MAAVCIQVYQGELKYSFNSLMISGILLICRTCDSNNEK